MEDFKLYNGVTIPAIGFGTWQAKNGKEAYQACRWALEAGYRHIDTAFVYGNEKRKSRTSVREKLKRFSDAVSQNKNRERSREKNKDRGQSL